VDALSGRPGGLPLGEAGRAGPAGRGRRWGMIGRMTVSLPDHVKALLDAPTFVVVSTIAKDGAPHSTVLWIKRDGDDLLFSTIRGRQKTRNLERDPRASVCAYDPADPLSYFTVEGDVTLTEEGGRELIDELSRKYTGEGFPVEGPERIRVVCRLTPRRILGQ
jgi:PPOX class probable F420-dependent enzyme